MQLNSRIILASIVVVICGAFIPLAATSQVPNVPEQLPYDISQDETDQRLNDQDKLIRTMQEQIEKLTQKMERNEGEISTLKKNCEVREHDVDKINRRVEQIKSNKRKLNDEPSTIDELKTFLENIIQDNADAIEENKNRIETNMSSINDSAFINLFNYQNNQKLDIDSKDAKDAINGLLDTTGDILGSVAAISANMVNLGADIAASALKIETQETQQGLFGNLLDAVQNTANDLGDALAESDQKIKDQEEKSGFFENLFGDVQSAASDLGDSLANSNLQIADLFGKQGETDNLLDAVQNTAKDLGDALANSDLKLADFEVKQGSFDNLLGDLTNTVVNLGVVLDSKSFEIADLYFISEELNNLIQEISREQGEIGDKVNILDVNFGNSEQAFKTVIDFIQALQGRMNKVEEDVKAIKEENE